MGGGRGIAGRRVRRVRGIAHQIEARRWTFYVALEHDALRSPSHIEHVARMQHVPRAVGGHGAGATDVENPHLAPLGEVGRGERRRRLQHEGLALRHNAADHRSIRSISVQNPRLGDLDGVSARLAGGHFL